MRERHALTQVDPSNRVAVCSVCGATGIYRAGLDGFGAPKYRCSGRGPGMVAPNPKARHMLSDIDATRGVATCAVCGPGQRILYRSVTATRRAWRCESTAPTGSHGLTRAERRAFIEQQGARCAICKSLDPKTALGWNVDHCHETMKIRGLLCRPCNQALGMFQDSPELLNAAAQYLLRGQDA